MAPISLDSIRLEITDKVFEKKAHCHFLTLSLHNFFSSVETMTSGVNPIKLFTAVVYNFLS